MSSECDGDASATGSSRIYRVLKLASTEEEEATQEQIEFGCTAARAENLWPLPAAVT